MADAPAIPKDANRVPVLAGVSSETTEISGVNYVEGETPVPVQVNPTTHAVKTENA